MSNHPQVNSTTSEVACDYKAMWARLRTEMTNLRYKGVSTIMVVVVDSFMDYIEQAAEALK